MQRLTIRCSRKRCPHLKGIAGHCLVGGCPNDKNACPLHGD
ncbi:MAG TPA: hypothetical protein VHE33_10495 [Acidobacteriaceae bacterium]|nr:hypothetical protein [Acidobacteriaceae bacterium]